MNDIHRAIGMFSILLLGMTMAGLYILIIEMGVKVTLFMLLGFGVSCYLSKPVGKFICHHLDKKEEEEK